MYLEDVDTIDKAAPLVKKNVYLPNKLKPVKGEEEFTLFDLVGFTAVDQDEGELGEITDVQEYPKQIIATVNFKGQEVLFPLNEDIIVGIDVVKEILTVDLPEGLLDIYME
ncbi:ribosome maturation factor RimM [Mucilaginibacter antarcticus]|uniref:ribosome maturation factor RimM n=1 Tax=Mucilaginibacter antarcticus TaxID=1855725 RepID=UPI00362DEB76